MKIKLIATIVILLTIASLATADSEAILQTLIDGDIKNPTINIYEDKTVVSYQTSLSSEEKTFREWMYIMGTVVEKNPSTNQVVIKCIFQDEEVMQVTGSTEAIVDYLIGETAAEAFLPKLVVRPIGEGPIISPKPTNPQTLPLTVTAFPNSLQYQIGDTLYLCYTVNKPCYARITYIKQNDNIVSTEARYVDAGTHTDIGIIGYPKGMRVVVVDTWTNNGEHDYAVTSYNVG